MFLLWSGEVRKASLNPDSNAKATGPELPAGGFAWFDQMA